MDAPYLGSFTGEAVALLRELMYEISGLNEASRGKNPSGGRSGEMLEALKSFDEEGGLPLQQGFEDALTDLGRLTLKIASRYYREERYARIVGPGGDVLVYEIKRADFRHGCDVKVLGDSGLPRSWAARVNMAVQLAANNLVDMSSREAVDNMLRFLELAPLASVWDGGEDVERHRIHQQNLMLLMGRPVPVEAKDLHKMHLTLRRQFMRSEEFDEALGQMPKPMAERVRALFYANTDEHESWLRIGNGLPPLEAAGEETASSASGAGTQPMGVGGMPLPGQGIRAGALGT